MEDAKYTGQLVFGLDIGTRSIVGTVGYKKGDQFIVTAQRSKEHETRAMLDGQIHDIQKVGETIAEVKEQLEAAIGRKLKEVCIAAAGRVLRTVTTHIEYPFTGENEVDREDIYALIAAGVEQAYQDFLKEQTGEEIRFYCVGHSVVRYYLNGYPMGNLEGHKARTIGVDLIATFLPEDVVDGLYKAVEIAGLEVGSLTLEPIAAIQLAIPERFRMLNIALLDVGAGTTDISITNDGCILAYGMIPMAGDILTETIAKHCLVDFATAEMIKRSAGCQEEISYMDIMLLPQTITAEEVKKITADIIEDMAQQASDRILELNGGKPVSAVFVVGGGGKIPGYTEAIAEKLGIAKERVALRGEEVMQQIIFEEEIKKDSLLVTPVGICLNFYEQSNNFIFVNFNGERLKIYDNNKLTIGDAAMQIQFPNDGLFPKRGKELHYTLNGTSKMARGQLGEAAVITLNGEAADIHTPIHANDLICVKESTMGEAAKLTISELPEARDILNVNVNGRKVQVPRFASVNGSLQSGYYEIQDGDEITFLDYYTVAQVAEFMDVVLDPHINLYVNNALADLDTPVYENFSLIWKMEEEERAPEAEPEKEAAGPEPDPEKASQKEEDTDPEKQTQEASEEKAVRQVHVLVNKKPVVLDGKSSYVYVDVFDQIEFDRTRPRGKGIVTTLNGRPAQYMEPITDGDVIEIYWQE